MDQVVQAAPQQQVAPTTAHHPVSLAHLHALRAGYLLVGGGLAVTRWPTLLHHEPWSPYEGVVAAMLVAVSVLALWGVRHPLRLLPVMLFEIAWKLVWYAVVAVPLWRDHAMTALTTSFAWECLLVVPLLAVVPWGYVVRQYVTARGDRWR